MVKNIALAALASVALSTPVAAAVTIEFGGSNGNPFSLTGTVGEIDYKLVARRFTVAPSDLVNMNQLGGPLRLRVTSAGVGVDGGGSALQLDTNNPNRREAFVLSTSESIRIGGLRLSIVDNNDTLMIFGINKSDQLIPLNATGTIRTGLGGIADVVNQNSLNRGTSTLTFAEPWGYFDRYLLTTRVGGDVTFGGDKGQGYRLDAITVNIVPEPRTWALLIAGFGMIGVAARRRTAQTA